MSYNESTSQGMLHFNLCSRIFAHINNYIYIYSYEWISLLVTLKKTLLSFLTHQMQYTLNRMKLASQLATYHKLLCEAVTPETMEIIK